MLVAHAQGCFDPPCLRRLPRDSRCCVPRFGKPWRPGFSWRYRLLEGCGCGCWVGSELPPSPFQGGSGSGCQGGLLLLLWGCRGGRQSENGMTRPAPRRDLWSALSPKIATEAQLCRSAEFETAPFPVSSHHPSSPLVSPRCAGTMAHGRRRWRRIAAPPIPVRIQGGQTQAMHSRFMVMSAAVLAVWSLFALNGVLQCSSTVWSGRSRGTLLWRLRLEPHLRICAVQPKAEAGSCIAVEPYRVGLAGRCNGG